MRYNKFMKDFDYLQPTDIYLDSACQSLRPQPVITAMNNYYQKFNSCGERVKYQWGKITDEKVNATRHKVLQFLKLKSKNYTVSFTLNTTYGINLLLSQLRPELFDRVITSDIEHNSPFLSTIAFAKTHHKERLVITRNPDGSIPLDQVDFTNALVVVNCASNFDGRQLLNISELIETVHRHHGIVIIDAAQAMAHSSAILYKTNPDAICFSAHKLYAPSLGVIVWHHDLIAKTHPTFIGGGMVDDVNKDTFQLSARSKLHFHTRFEPGLQAWGEIIGLGAALDWLQSLSTSDHQNLTTNSKNLFTFLKSHQHVHLVNQQPNPTISFYLDHLNSHLLGEALSRENIMARTGYFCVHYYLDHVCHFPPLIRFSLGYHNRPTDIQKLQTILTKVLN